MTVDQFISRFLATFPEARAEDPEEVELFRSGDINAHGFCATVINPYVERMVLGRNPERLRDIFALVETGLTDVTDPRLEDMLQVGLLEFVEGSATLSEAVRPHLGPHTREASHL